MSARPQVVDGWLVFPPAMLRRVANKNLSISVARHRDCPRDFLVVADIAYRIRCPLLKKPAKAPR